MIRYDRYIHKDVGRRGDDAGGQRALTPLLSLGGGGGVQLVTRAGARGYSSSSTAPSSGTTLVRGGEDDHNHDIHPPWVDPQVSTT